MPVPLRCYLYLHLRKIVKDRRNCKKNRQLSHCWVPETFEIAFRDGAPPVELVDGEKLAGMLEKLELGLKPRHTFDLDAAFFDEYKK